MDITKEDRTIHRHCRKTGLTLVVGLLAVGVLVSAQKPDADKLPTLEKALLTHAPEIIKEMGKQKVKNVGVVSFQVKWDKGQASGNVGPLNRRMANRLETALVLRMSKEDNLRLIRGAGDTVAATGLSHLKAKDRPEFFKLDYEPAWGKGTVKADCLLSGMVSFEPKSNRCKVSIEGFDVSGKIKPLSSFYVQADPRLYSEAGVSFVTARSEDQKTRLIRPKIKPQPSADVLASSPVDLQILFDDKPVAVTRITDTTAYPEGILIPEPKPGQTVAFKLVHRSSDSKTYGVVLKINGKNTIFPDEPQIDDLDSYKYVLMPRTDVTIRGVQTRPGKSAKFQVRPVESSESKASYGSHAGTIGLTIFRGIEENDVKGTPAQKPEATAAEAAIRAAMPIGRAKSLEESQKLVKTLAANFAERMSTSISLGQEFNQPIQRVSFKAYPVEVFSITVRYSKRTEK